MNIPLNIDWQQIFLHLLNFAILAAGLYLLLYKPVKDFMDRRTEYYRHLDEETKAKLEEAQNVKADYDRQLQGIDEEIAKRKAESAKELLKSSEEEMKRAKMQAEKIVLNARKEAELEHDRIVDDAQKEVAEMVTLATEKLLLQSTASESFDQFLAAVERSEQNEESEC